MLLSPSGLALFRACPRCFWLHHVRGLRRPRTPFPSLPTGIDGLLKADADRHRPQLPPWLTGVPGQLYPHQGRIDRWRDFRAGLRSRCMGVELLGVLDDVLVVDELVAPLDWKTSGHRPRGSGERWYADQLAVYTLLLEHHGLPVLGQGLIVYVWPTAIVDDSFAFASQGAWIEAPPERAERLVQRALACLAGELPPPGQDCGWCEYLARDRRR